MFTCISCRVAFETAAEQRAHFSTDWHRYNMKRRVANLPPVAAESFNEKVIERREQNAVRTDPRSLVCDTCNKNFSSENAFRSHVQSKKHRDREAARPAITMSAEAPSSDLAPNSGHDIEPMEEHRQNVADIDTEKQGSSVQFPSDTLKSVDEGGHSSESESDAGEDDFATRIAKSRRRIQPTDCLFCSTSNSTTEENVTHMSKAHSFFIPDQDILVDVRGLLSYLGEKVAIGNLCLFCPNGGREFGSLEAVRKHMRDKAHCKLAYDSEEDRAELADFYDYGGDVSESEWEDLDGDMEEDSRIDNALDTQHQRPMSLAPDGLSLMLPSGRTLGHRSLRIYYSQRLRSTDSTNDRTNNIAAKVAQVRQRLADPSLALVPVAGGHGAFGRGQQLMKARNAGEAKWARRQGRSFKDQYVKEQHKTKVGFVHNNQKHFRDPLLQ
ncbi:hypothetical protein IAT40_004893 [Kwoniella sp. CBS 6097]